MPKKADRTAPIEAGLAPDALWAVKRRGTAAKIPKNSIYYQQVTRSPSAHPPPVTNRQNIRNPFDSHKSRLNPVPGIAFPTPP
jgi:hypothetical protein